jgi:arsenate reductase (thioredoxin)
MTDLTSHKSGTQSADPGQTQSARVLFLCTHNSARSLMAEALVRHLAGERFEVLSAGLRPGDVHPLTRRVLEERGIDTSTLRSKGLETIMGRIGIKYAIMVCEEAEMACPRIYPFAVQTLRWPFEDPAAATGNEATQLAKFREVRDTIERRLRSWLTEIAEESTP